MHTCQKELMSHYAVPHVPPREKNSSLQTADCGASALFGGVIVRLIGLCGSQWTRLHLTPTRLGSFLAGAMQTPEGNVPPQLSSAFLKLIFRGHAANSITDGSCTPATCLPGAPAYLHRLDLEAMFLIYLDLYIWYVESKIDWIRFWTKAIDDPRRLGACECIAVQESPPCSCRLV